jgi:signal transduction histidine kinase
VSLILRIVRVGIAAALVAGLTGFGLERARFGPSDQSALNRVEAELRQRFDGSAATLGTIAARIAAEPDTARTGPRDQATLRRLFDIAAAAVPEDEAGRTGITIYDATGTPLAWAGRVSDLRKEVVLGSATLLVVPGPLGPGLIRIEAVSRNGARVATVVVEQALGTVRGGPGLTETFAMPTSLVPVTLRVRAGGATSPPQPFRFVVPARDGGFVLEADVSPGDLASARARWRAMTWAALLGVLAVTLLLCTGPLLDLRRQVRDRSRFLWVTSLLIAVVVVARGVLYAALAPLAQTAGLTPLDLLLTTLAMAAVVWLVLDLIERRRFARPRVRMLAPTTGARIAVAAGFLLAGLASGWLLWGYERLLRRVVADTNLDLLHFSLHPVGGGRLAVAFALVLLHAAVIWGAAAIIRLPATLLRAPRARTWRLTAAGGWCAGAVIATEIARRVGPAVPLGPLWSAILAAGACALALARVNGRMRRVSQTARLAVFFLALLTPAVAMYPSLLAHATEAKERLIATAFGPQAASLREDLQRQLQQAVEQIDAIPSLDELVRLDDSTPAPDPTRAFAVWSRTDLAAYRLTSAVELYSSDGRLVSAFRLSLPEYATMEYRAAGCVVWEQPFDEVSPFGSSERHVLRTARGVCVRGRMVGSIVVRVMLDYRTLPLISLQSPYLESLRPNRQVAPEGVSGRDVEFIVYGWSRAPIFESGTRVWTLPDPVFQRLIASREPFWATLDRDGQTFRVDFLSDRGGIYALGYPVISWVGHLINLAELVMLAVVLYVTLLAALTLFSALGVRTAAGGRALLREVRSSFYRKLFLAFWAGAVVPMFILAIFIRTYVATQLLDGAAEAAARTVTTAQRLVEDYAALQQRGATALDAIDDQIMVLVRRAIDEDVNLFDRTRLQATSARDLFASRLLSPRTPGDVYRSILLDRLPTYVGQEQVGDLPYQLAAAPVRASGREGIVTVPMTNRQQQIEQQIDELDRRVLSGFVLFSLLGAALGYWMAERIADPVNRLTRATRRIARGDLDARVAATSSDELRRLVEDFNQMAADLKRQRSELEHTQRLEAWADMARQVAHDIKNPLTPIQLSAEHAQRVNIDRGRPLSPVLDECVTAILSQVKLLRQISAEFSSFASSPTPRPEPTALPALIDEVVEPYRSGLANRIAIEVLAPADLPDVTIDRTLFARALTNVIENALHAMPGTGRLTVVSRQSAIRSPQSGLREPQAALSSSKDAMGIVVEVTDTGVGMDQDALNKIFEPYFSTKATGTGLGLTIAKRNIELNRGTIAVTSQRGAGTTVTMTLPIG